MSRLSNCDVDNIVQMQYEDALAEEEEWALEAYEARKVVKSAVTPAADDWLAPGSHPANAGTTDMEVE